VAAWNRRIRPSPSFQETRASTRLGARLRAPRLSSPEVSGADVAETGYICFAGTRHAITVRLIVRRVRPRPASRLALFSTFDYHAFVTDRPGDMLEIEADHRRHAIVEQSIAELKSSGSRICPPDDSWPTLPGSPWP
jgi:hypothetical protein